jgi:predicted hydrolase (HD superfamily)
LSDSLRLDAKGLSETLAGCAEGASTMKDTITRNEAWALIQEYGCTENHICHMLAVEAAMRAYADYFDEDQELWGAVGLVHDFDYDEFPDEHPYSGGRILRQHGYSDAIVNTVLAHGETGTPRDTKMAKALYAVDELTGLIVAVALVRPSKDIRDVKVKSVRKKWKDKAFAAAVDRERIERATEDLDVDLWDHIARVLKAMQGVASEIALDGRLAG